MEVSLLLAAGTRVGPYEVLGLLGAGGMGEVSRARDPRLGRDVALKVLPERFAHSEDRLSRFEREARSAGRLNHPNILTVFDVGSDAGIHYLVSELLEGETFRKAAASHAIPVDRAVAWMLQAAEGLACAHEAGILHRDLKPENLFLTRDGRLKILDFGLVKLVQPSSGVPREAETATRHTEAGRRMGTAAYMSPEQIRDEPLDGRCDLFALGAILYELIARRPAFVVRRLPKSPSPVSLYAVPLTSNPGRELEPALSRDGHRIAFASDGDQDHNFDLYTKGIGAETALRLTSHKGQDGSPAWSPDGRSIAFIRVEGGKGTVILGAVQRGCQRKLLDLDTWYGSSISFSPDGRWIALSSRPSPGAAFWRRPGRHGDPGAAHSHPSRSFRCRRRIPGFLSGRRRDRVCPLPRPRGGAPLGGGVGCSGRRGAAQGARPRRPGHRWPGLDGRRPGAPVLR